MQWRNNKLISGIVQKNLKSMAVLVKCRVDWLFDKIWQKMYVSQKGTIHGKEDIICDCFAA